MLNIPDLINPRLDNAAASLVALSYLQHLAAEERDRELKYTEFRNYYHGEQDTMLTDRLRAYLELTTGQEFRANYMPIVVDALAERLTVTGFNADAQGGKDGILWEWWTKNRMDAVQGDVHTAALRDGDNYLIVEWDADNQRPTFIQEPAYDGDQGVRVHYRKDKRNQIHFATKRWRIQKDNGRYVNRLNVYAEEAIWRFTDDPDLPGRPLFMFWRPYEIEGVPWPEPWLTADGRPLGVPIVHFKNKAKGYTHGMSELDAVIPMQNALNKAIIDLLGGADTGAFGMMKMIGAEPKDADGNLLTVAPGQWIYTTKNGTTIDRIPGDDMRPLIDVVDSFITRIAQISRTPLSYFQASKQMPSADAQQAGDSGLVSKASDRSVYFGNSWEDAMILGRRIFNAFSQGQPLLDESVDIETVWNTFERVNKDEAAARKATTAKTLIDSGANPLAAYIQAGYSEEEAEQLAAVDRVLPIDQTNPFEALQLAGDFESGGENGESA